MQFRTHTINRASTGALLAGIGIGAWLANRYMRRRQRRLDFAGKAVVIAGGSRGLGLEMARLLAGEGARLAILARNEPELEAAREELTARSELAVRMEQRGQGPRVLAIVCDVGVRDQAEAALARAAAAFGGIDVLINAAGIIQVAPVEHLTIEDYENAMAVHFWGPLYTMLAAIPYMRRAGGGRIVNVSSIGGRVAVPHLAPYVASKFALEGLSDTFRAELARDNILVSTINPGLMRTGSYFHGNFKGQQEKEFAWFSLLSSQPATAMNARRAAQQVLHAVRYGAAERTLTLQARLLRLLEAFAPNLTAWIMKQSNRWLLPAPGGAHPERLMTGFESRSKGSPSRLRTLGDRAAERNNEMIAERAL